MINELRRATIEDLPEIIKIYNEAIKDGISTADSKIVTVEDKLEWFHSHASTRPILVKEYHGRIIAWISVQPFYANLLAYNHSARINIYIDKNFQGKKLGQQFLSEAIDQAKHYEIDLGYDIKIFIFRLNFGKFTIHITVYATRIFDNTVKVEIWNNPKITAFDFVVAR